MAEQFKTLHLFAGATVSIRDVQCRPNGCDHGQEEMTVTNNIVFTRAGAFVKHIRGRDILGDANHALFFNRHEPYRVSHPISGGDDCTVFTFTPEILVEAWGSRDPSVVERPERPFRSTHFVSDSATFMRQQRLRTILRGAPGEVDGAVSIDPLAVEALAIELLAAIVNADCQGWVSRPRWRREDTIAAHRDQAHAAQTLLARRFRERVSLDDVARWVHSSPYHLARIFRREIGLPIHRYVNRLRLRAAVELLGAGCDDLTQLALDVGYSSHSHFTNAFRREFQISPSDFRRSIHRFPCEK